MRLEYTYTPQDLQDLLRVKLGRTPARWQRSIIGVALFFPLAGVLFFLMQHKGTTPAPQPPLTTRPTLLADLFLPLIPWLLIFSFIWFFIFRSFKSAGKKLFNSSRSIQLSQTVEIDDDGIRVIHSLGSAQSNWRAYVAWSESKNLVVLFLSKTHKFGIPKRAMSPEQLEELREILRARIVPSTGGFPILNVKRPG